MLSIKTKPCRDCGTPIKRVQHKSRCAQCQEKHTRFKQEQYNQRRLGSSQLFKTLSNGRLIPADFGCGKNTKNGFPLKKQVWMVFHLNEDSTPTDKDLEERDKVINEGIVEQEGDWKRTMLYEWKFDIDRDEKPMTKKEMYKKWKYYETLKY